MISGTIISHQALRSQAVRVSVCIPGACTRGPVSYAEGLPSRRSINLLETRLPQEREWGVKGQENTLCQEGSTELGMFSREKRRARQCDPSFTHMEGSHVRKDWNE